MPIKPSLLPQESQSSFNFCLAAAGSGTSCCGRLRVGGGGEAADPGERVEVRQPEVQRLAAAHRQPGQRPVLAVRLDRVARLDRRNHVLQQILLERGERRRAAEDVPFGPVVLLCPAVGHDDDHRRGLPVGQQVVEEDVGRGESLPFRLVAADAVQQIEHRILLVRASSRAACRPASCGAVPTVFESYSIISSLPCGIPSRFALNARRRIGKRRNVVGLQDDGSAKPAFPWLGEALRS